MSTSAISSVGKRGIPLNPKSCLYKLHPSHRVDVDFDSMPCHVLASAIRIVKRHATCLAKLPVAVETR